VSSLPRDSWSLKRDRAVEHLEALEAVISSLIKGDPKPIRLVSQPNAEETREEFRVHIVSPIPPRVDLIFGDCVHNLRSALDHLAVALGVLNGADPNDDTISFPIRTSEAAFYRKYESGSRKGAFARSSGMHSIRALGPDAQAFIEGLQPYRRPDQLGVLWELQYLDNRDKHRSLNTHYFQTIATFEQADKPVGVSVEYGTLSLEDGAHVATVLYPAGYQGMKVHPMLSAAIGIGRSNRYPPGSFHIIPGFLRDNLLPVIDAILDEASKRFFGA
jgi:hypothetical protein